MKLHYRKIGKGQPLVLLHGFLGSSDNMLSIGKKFEDRYEVFIPDLRNHGHSPHHNNMTYRDMKDDMMTFFEENRISSATVLGHSMGGKLAMQFALDVPEKVNKLIIVDIGLRKYSLNHLQYLNIIKKIKLNCTNSRKELEKIFSMQIDDQNIVKLLLKNIERNKNKELCWRINIDVFNSNILDEIRTEKTFNKPVLLVRGALSDYIYESDLEALKKHFPLIKSEVVPDSGHWVHVDNTVYFNKILECFL